MLDCDAITLENCKYFENIFATLLKMKENNINIFEVVAIGLETDIHYIYNVIDYCSQTQAVYDHLWNCSYPINELLHSFLDLFTGVKKYVVYY